MTIALIFTNQTSSNATDRMRPHTVPSMDTLCLAQFASHYYKEYSTNSETSDAQPEILTHDAIELHVQLDTNTDLSSQLPPRIKLINSNEIMKCRKIRAVVRYHTPNKTKEPENYFHHLLMLYYPSHNEDTQVGSERTYASKFNEPEVQAVVEENRALFEPDADAISEALEAFRNNEGTSILHSFDSLNDQENDDLHLDVQGNCEREEESFNKQVPSHLASKSNSGHMPAVPTISSHIQPTEISYDFSRGAGAGKSNLIKTIYHSVVKTLKLTITNTVLPTVLLMAPTGVSAINIDGTTINTALAIPKLTGDNLPTMSDQKKTQMRVSMSELKLIIIRDEISMVSNITLVHIHQRLLEIFGFSSSQLFAGLSVIAVGDLYQLPPVNRKPVFSEYKAKTRNLYHPWQVLL
ncbi:ATP-dependent DNA helicase PIF5-like [Stylophora pistillata]|uniref:ATP-dependent DNA helicase PIF5-like n=1 Tax=Stylophora pistillata TaxID=50429 RepID=UPI000C0549AD|nr:ATP-dependent DNA helicase PIF5-like [Stylophora pistillata]